MARPLELTNQSFGKLLVLREAELWERKEPTRRSWVCQCDCGNLTVVTTSHLTSGHTTSCGCQRYQSLKQKRVDYTNTTFGRFTVLRDADNRNGKRYVLCRCECGVEKEICLADLKSGKTQSCGCYRNDKVREAITTQPKDNPGYYTDLTGKTFHYLTVLEFDLNTTIEKRTSSNKRSYWKCQCKCGNEISVAGTSLTTGSTKSCGCLSREKASERIHLIQPLAVQKLTGSLVGQRFDKLLVLELDTELSGKGQGSFWKCQCECGNITTIAYSSLVQGSTHSCGCLKMSVGEYLIDQLLTENNIEYLREVKFEDLKDVSYLRFDFGVYNKGQLVLLIEYDGKQHSDPNSCWFSNTVVKHDEMKNEYCKKNNIPLLRIPYTLPKEQLTIDLITPYLQEI